MLAERPPLRVLVCAAPSSEEQMALSGAPRADPGTLHRLNHYWVV